MQSTRRKTMRTLFNDGWEFSKHCLETSLEEILECNTFEEVDLPHDWLIYDTNNLYQDSIGCYRKKLFVDVEEDQQYFVRFEGVYMDSTIYLNGTKIYEWKYGYSTFEVELTEYIKQGNNEIIVKCVYRNPNTRWYSGAGIYRNVWFIKKPKIHFVSDGTYISTKKEENLWNVQVDVEVSSDAFVLQETNRVMVQQVLVDSEKNEIATCVQEVQLTEGVFVVSQEFGVSNVIPWDIEHPYLYTLISQLIVDGVVWDEVTQRIGFRTIRFDCNEGFFLNEKNIKINGACQHHDLGSLGAAMNPVALKRQLTMLMEMGVNSIRTSHNMPSVELMDFADEMGLLVYCESFDMWERPKTEFDYSNYFKEWWQRDVQSWVKRDRNHPSLIIWGIGNEISDTNTEDGIRITKQLRDAVRELDPRKNAYISLGSNYIEWEWGQKCSDELDLSGYNYYEKLYDEHHKKYPNWCIFGSETSSTVQSRGVYHFPLANRLLTHEDLQCSCLGNCTTNWGAKNVDTLISDHRDRNFVFGQYIWTGWDYIGEPTPYHTKNSYFGQIDTAGFKKDTFYHYQAEWTDYKKHPMVHILPYWDYNEGQLIDVCVYSNAPEVELILNGESLGRHKIDHQHDKWLQGNWQVRYTKGELIAKAYDENGKVIAVDTQTSFEDAVELVAKPDKYILDANGQDLIFVEINTIDQNKHYVANARNRVNVTVSGAGRLVGLDNGDSTDYDQYKGTSRKLFSGKLMAIIAAKKEAGRIHVSIESEGLRSAYVDLIARNAEEIQGLEARVENKKSEENKEIPVRKIELIPLGSSHLTPECDESLVEVKVFPSNATYNALTFRAMTISNVESYCATVEQVEDKNRILVRIHAKGDGEFRFCCSAKNGKDAPEVISELDYRVEGFGLPKLDAYRSVPASLYSGATCDVLLSFQGGLFLDTTSRTTVSFERVDFGDEGANQVSLSFFSFADELPVEVWIGDSKEEAICVLKDKYFAKSWYNHYQSNTWKLNRTIKGVQTVQVVVEPESKMSFGAFQFSKEH